MILSQTVEYIQTLKQQQAKQRQELERMKKLEDMNRRLVLKVQEYEGIMAQQGLQLSDQAVAATEQLRAEVVQQGQGNSVIPQLNSPQLNSPQLNSPQLNDPHLNSDMNLISELLMEDSTLSSTQSSDPMLSACTSPNTLNLDDIDLEHIQAFIK